MDWKNKLHTHWKRMGFDSQTVAEYEQIFFCDVDATKTLHENSMRIISKHRLFWLEKAGIHQIPHTREEYLKAWWSAYGLDEHPQHVWFGLDEVISRLRKDDNCSDNCLFWNQMNDEERDAYNEFEEIWMRIQISEILKVPDGLLRGKVKLWRGVTVHKKREVSLKPHEIGKSWTDDWDKARWDAARNKSQDANGFIIEATFETNTEKNICKPNQILGLKLGWRGREFLVDTSYVQEARVVLQI